MRTTASALLVFASLSSSPVRADEIQNVSTGNGLLANCADSDHYIQGFCDGYIIGVTRLGDGRGAFCVPPGVSQGQIFEVVKNGLRRHPEERQQESTVLMVKYLGRAFPCPKK